jgi:uncharacterized delta-60 repeat protein
MPQGAGRLTSSLAVAVCALALAAPAAAAPGDLDETFSKDGKTVTEMTGDLVGLDSYASATIVQPDGKLLVAGRAYSENYLFGLVRSVALVARYLPDGSLDPSFSGDGLAAVHFEPGDAGDRSYATAIALAPDGAIVIAGGRSPGPFAPSDRAGAARLAPDGELDTSFGGGDGTTTVPFASGAGALALRADGRIVLGGTANGDFALARLQADGDLDPAFDGDGLLTTDIGGNDGVAGLALAGEKIIAGGAGGPGLALARYLPSGGLDPGFGNGGLATTVASVASVGGLTEQPDGRLVVGALLRGKEPRTHGALMRFDANGSPDPSFSADGVARLGEFGSPLGIAVQPDGRLLVAGGSGFGLARILVDGTLDDSFSDDGLLQTHIGGNDDESTDLTIQPDGRIVVVGSRGRNMQAARDLANDVALSRYEVAPGPRDADADGIRDRQDRCPEIYSKRHGGCVLVARKINLRVSPGRIRGEIVAAERACENHEKVELLARRAGPDRRLARLRTGAGDLSRSAFELRLGRSPEAVYARAPAHVDASAGLCAATRSKTVGG